jgi:hypothetical protein
MVGANLGLRFGANSGERKRASLLSHPDGGEAAFRPCGIGLRGVMEKRLRLRRRVRRWHLRAWRTLYGAG